VTWRQIVDRSHGHIEQLAPTFRDRVGKWYAELLAKRIPVLVYCSVRTPREQDELYAQGRTKKGTKVTNARGTPVPQSFHCYGRAIDAVPCAVSPHRSYEPAWNDGVTYQLMRNCAAKYQMRWLAPAGRAGGVCKGRQPEVSPRSGGARRRPMDAAVLVGSAF